jgi:hypothetical protein
LPEVRGDGICFTSRPRLIPRNGFAFDAVVTLPETGGQCGRRNSGVGARTASPIECDSDLTRGMTVVDRLDVAADPRNSAVWSEAVQSGPKTEICWKLDVRGWKASLVTALKAANRAAQEQGG